MPKVWPKDGRIPFLISLYTDESIVRLGMRKMWPMYMRILNTLLGVQRTICVVGFIPVLTSIFLESVSDEQRWALRLAVFHACLFAVCRLLKQPTITQITQLYSLIYDYLYMTIASFKFRLTKRKK